MFNVYTVYIHTFVNAILLFLILLLYIISIFNLFFGLQPVC